MSIYKPLCDSREHPKIRLLRLFRPLSDQPDRAQIRLLRLHPGDFNDPIECDLKITTYAKSVDKYEAISYCWGDAGDTVPLTCNGIPTMVTRSLHGALRRFRQPRGTAARSLWADALCINQKDNEEKGKQVGRIGDVFANASRVLVWLGGNVDDTTAADTFAMICEINQYLGEVHMQCQKRYLAIPPLLKPYPICLEEDRWIGITALLDCPWFTRVWTLQEAALAKNCAVFWGNAEFDAADIIELCLWCTLRSEIRQHIDTFSRPPLTSMLYLNFCTYVHYRSGCSGSEKWFSNRPFSASLANEEDVDVRWVDILDKCSLLEATDARDYIYAVLGCPAARSNDGHPYVEADYAISKDELYKRIARTLLRNPKEGPWVLCATGCSDREELLRSHMPSWAACWDTGRLSSWLSNHLNRFKAGGPESLLQTKEQDDAILSVCGHFFDEVTWMSDIIESRSFLIAQDQPDAEPYIDKLWDQISTQVSRIGKALQHKDFLLTLIRGFPSPGPNPEAWQMRKLSAYLKSVSSNMTLDMSQEALIDEYGALQAQSDLAAIDDCRVIVTLHGRIGLVHAPTTRLGDTLCIFHGVSVPFVLALTTDGRFKLAGHAYIHGVMRGELVDQSKAENILLE